MSHSQQPPARGSAPRRGGFYSRLQRELEREGAGSEGAGPAPRSLLNSRLTAEATAAARRAAAMQSEGDHNADLHHGHDPLDTPSRRPSSTATTTTTAATASSLRRVRQHSTSRQPPPPQPASRQIPPPRDLLQVQQLEREQDTTLFSSPPPAVTTLPIYRTPRINQQSMVTPAARPMGFDSPALFASPASPSWSSVDHHGPLAMTPDVFRPTMPRSLLRIPNEPTEGNINSSDQEQEVEAEGQHAGNQITGAGARSDSSSIMRRSEASSPSVIAAATVSEMPTSPSGGRPESPSRPYGEWRQHAQRLESQYASRYGSPRRERGEIQGQRLEFRLQQDEALSRRPHVAAHPGARFLRGDIDGTISPPRRLNLAAMTLSPSTPASVTTAAEMAGTLPSSSAAGTTTATSTVAAPAAAGGAGAAAASRRARLADDPDEFWSSGSSGQRSTRLLPNIPNLRQRPVPRPYRRGPEAPSSSSLSQPQQSRLPPPSIDSLSTGNDMQSDRGSRDAGPQYASRSSQGQAIWQEILGGRRVHGRESGPGHIRQHQHQDQDSGRQDRRQQEREEQYVHEIYEDPESDEAADGEEYDQNEPGVQAKEPTEQHVEEEDEDEEGGLPIVDPSADLLLDASRAYRARHLSNASRRLSQESEDPFQSSGRRHKRARFNDSFGSLDEEVSIMANGSFGGNASAEMVPVESVGNESADMAYQEQERDLNHEDINEIDDSALLYDDLDEQGQEQQPQLPGGGHPSSLYDVDVDTSLQVGLADSDAEAEVATVDEADLYGLFESPPPELGTNYRRSVDDYEEQDTYEQHLPLHHGHDDAEPFLDRAIMGSPPSVQRQDLLQQEQPYMNGDLSSDSEAEEAIAESNEETDQDEEDEEEEAERLRQLIEATVNQGPEAVAVLSGFRAPGSVFQGPVQREVLPNVDDPTVAPDARDELRERQVLNEELWWDLEPRELDSREERVL
ncbi:hypothetical protein EMPS_05066 [Entomortierella parvispora]|uniref:Uncharacterized protein n=1 Tax=Entomortierella parvispora TaxID=205924 RepID=A0A9P3HAB8_9FUNG|nr:hypothetical protein EMPS_05066 [Entomortierella parvispora]